MESFDFCCLLINLSNKILTTTYIWLVLNSRITFVGSWAFIFITKPHITRNTVKTQVSAGVAKKRTEILNCGKSSNKMKRLVAYCKCQKLCTLLLSWDSTMFRSQNKKMQNKTKNKYHVTLPKWKRRVLLFIDEFHECL